jgi:ABC-type multidrug transport system ATPase subunit
VPGGDIINVLRAEAERGCGILMSATDVRDLALMCDRVLIVRDGRVVAELTGEFDQDDIVEATFRPAQKLLTAAAASLPQARWWVPRCSSSDSVGPTTLYSSP